MPNVKKIRADSFALSPDKNNRLVKAIEEAGYKSITEFAKLSGLGIQVVLDLIYKRNSYSPAWMERIHCVMCDLGKLFHELFDVEEYEREELAVSDKVIIAEIRFAESRLADSADLLPDETESKLHEAVQDLERRERDVICHRFGLYDFEKTQAEIGTIFGVTGHRIAQIEKRALRKLRHPTRSAYFERNKLGEEYAERELREKLAGYVSPTVINVIRPIRAILPFGANLTSESANDEVVVDEVSLSETATEQEPVDEKSEVVEIPENQLKGMKWLEGLFAYAKLDREVTRFSARNCRDVLILEKYLGLGSTPQSPYFIARSTVMMRSIGESLVEGDVKAILMDVSELIARKIRVDLPPDLQHGIHAVLRNRLSDDFRPEAIDKFLGRPATSLFGA